MERSLRIVDASATRADSAASRESRAGAPLTWLCAGVAAAASTLGLVAPNAYATSDATVEMLRGFDAVMLVVVVPGLVVAALLRRPRTELMRSGLLTYTVYAALVGAITGGLGVAFLAHVLLLASASITLLVTLGPSLAGSSARLRSRWAAFPLALLALSLTLMWTISAVRTSATGDTPEGSLLVEDDLTVRLGMILDLWLIVPLYALAAVLLWRGDGPGRVVGYVAVVSGLVHQLAYTTALMFQSHADIAGAQAFDPFEPAIICLYVVGLAGILVAERPRRLSRSMPG